MQRLVLIQLANVTASEENYGVIKVYTNCSSGIYNMRLFPWDMAKIVKKAYSFPQINIGHFVLLDTIPLLLRGRHDKKALDVINCPFTCAILL